MGVVQLSVTFLALGTPHRSAWIVNWGETGTERWVLSPSPANCSDGASPPHLAGFLLVPLARVAATSIPLLGEDYIIRGNVLSHPLQNVTKTSLEWFLMASTSQVNGLPAQQLTRERAVESRFKCHSAPFCSVVPELTVPCDHKWGLSRQGRRLMHLGTSVMYQVLVHSYFISFQQPILGFR